MTATIYHNPACDTSRNTLAMIRASGEEPVVVEYRRDPPSRERLKELLAAMGLRPRSLLREKGTPYAEHGLADPSLTDAMLAHPDLIQRPSSRRPGAPASAAPPSASPTCSTRRWPSPPGRTASGSATPRPPDARCLSRPSGPPLTWARQPTRRLP